MSAGTGLSYDTLEKVERINELMTESAAILSDMSINQQGLLRKSTNGLLPDAVVYAIKGSQIIAKQLPFRRPAHEFEDSYQGPYQERVSERNRSNNRPGDSKPYGQPAENERATQYSSTAEFLAARQKSRRIEPTMESRPAAQPQASAPSTSSAEEVKPKPAAKKPASKKASWDAGYITNIVLGVIFSVSIGFCLAFLLYAATRNTESSSLLKMLRRAVLEQVNLAPASPKPYRLFDERVQQLNATDNQG